MCGAENSGRRGLLSPHQVMTADKLREKGYSWELLARRFGVSSKTVRRAVQAYRKTREDNDG